MLAQVLAELRERLAAATLPLDVAGALGARRAAGELVDQIDDYILPRLSQIEAPLLVVLGGSTGSGKSTILNSLVRAQVSPAGVLRPTTRVPVLVCHPDDARWFSNDRILPGLARSEGATPSGGRGLHVVSDDDVGPGMALLDAPDFDSVIESNRQLAAQLLAAADLWLFVTTANRYSDAVPWEFLRTARARATAVAMVLNRVPPEAADEVPNHLKTMLGEEGLGGSRLFVVKEADLAHGLIPDNEVEALRGWLTSLAADEAARREVVWKTLGGALESIPARVDLVALGIESQIEAVADLERSVAASYGNALSDVDRAIDSGEVLRGEVLARWHEIVGTGELMQNLEAGLNRLRTRLRQVFTGEPPAAAEVAAAVGDSLQVLIVDGAETAAERVGENWRATPAGRQLLSTTSGLDRASTEIRAAVRDDLREWQHHVLEMVRTQAGSKRTTGRVLSFGINGVGAALMIATFAHTGGLTGGEVVIAGGTAALSQKLLEYLFGEQAVAELTTEARRDLVARIGRFFNREKERYLNLAHSLAPDPALADDLRTLAQRVKGASS